MKRYFTFLLLFSGISCRICPDPNYVTFEKSTLTFDLESEVYYIQQIQISNYIQEQGSIDLIDSTQITILKKEGIGTSKLKADSLPSNYQSNSDIKNLFSSPNVRFEIFIKKIDSTKNEKLLLNDRIVFTMSELNNEEKEKFGSKHPCP